jgi:hypothetical protein
MGGGVSVGGFTNGDKKMFNIKLYMEFHLTSDDGIVCQNI